MERERNIKHFIEDIFKLGGGIFQRQPHKAANESLTTSFGPPVPYNKEWMLSVQYRSLLKKNLQSFGTTDGFVTIEDVATLLQNMTTTFPEADRFMGFQFSQLTGDLQTTLLTNPEVRNATIEWMSDVHQYLIERHQNLERETEEWEEERGGRDIEFRSLTAEAGRQIKASGNAIKLLGGDQDPLLNSQI